MSINLNLNNVLDDIEKFCLDEQKMLIDIVKKRLIDAERAEIKEEYDKLKKLQKSGKLKTYSVEEFFEELEN